MYQHRRLAAHAAGRIACQRRRIRRHRAKHGSSGKQEEARNGHDF
jgi:hypothetical protein